MKLLAENWQSVFTAPKRKCDFSDVVETISDAKITADGRYIVARDYLTLKIWVCTQM